MTKTSLAAALLLLCGTAAASNPGRDPAQPIDQSYTARIAKYTTRPEFSSPLVDYLPSSKTVPTPEAVLGDIAGAPGKLPYAEDVDRYMRMLEKASPRVRVFSIGKTEEGREMIAVAVASEELISKMDENRARLAQLADPRAIGSDDAKAASLVEASAPVYYITGTIHSPETGAPTALMELAYRLAVDDSPYVREIRDHLITLITPVVEVDGRDRMVDLYRWHLAHPGETWPPLVYWGHYVAHDNNRDAMGLTLDLTRNVLSTFVGQKAQVLHDLHESVPYLYDNTAGDGPFNAWLDPILTNEWEQIAWNNVQEMTRFGMPGVFTHGDFDTWSPGYLMFIAATHNGISRLYETFGNGGADTVERTLEPEEYNRTWYKQNPPYPKALWSQRDNNNYEETGLLVSLHYFALNRQQFLSNFYLKAKRAVEKPKLEGPAAYVFPADDPRPAAQAALLSVLALQGCEISKATAPFTVEVEVRKKPKKPADEGNEEKNGASSEAARPKTVLEKKSFKAGSIVLRMDQPYSRIADALLDYQYWSPKDPQKHPYDDTGWTFGELFGVEVTRVADRSVLEVPMKRIEGPIEAPGGLRGRGTIALVDNDAEDALATLRYRFPSAEVLAAEQPFDAAGRHFSRGSLLIRGVSSEQLESAGRELGLEIVAVSKGPSVPTHPVGTPRIAMVHSWLSTQSEGWWRMAFDRMKIPYTEISTQAVAAASDLRGRFDVLVFPPVGRNPQATIAGMPMWGNPLPWEKTDLTPNIGRIDSTEDMRPGLGFEGLGHLADFVRKGGLLITAMDTSVLATDTGLTPGVSIKRASKLKLVGSVVRSRVVDPESPVAYGYSRGPSLYCDDGPIFEVSRSAGGFGRRRPSEAEKQRPTGRGGEEGFDHPVGRPWAEPPERPEPKPWQPEPLTDGQKMNPIYVIPEGQRPRVILIYAASKDLLVSGLAEDAKEIAEHPAVVDAALGQGHVLLFSNNPVWRGETRASHALVLNAILNWNHLDAGRTSPPKTGHAASAPSPER